MNWLALVILDIFSYDSEQPHQGDDMKVAMKWLSAGIAAMSMAGCMTVNEAPKQVAHVHSHWVVHPFSNFTETPLAGQRAAAITKAMLQSRGIDDVRGYYELTSEKQLLPGAAKPLTVPEMLRWSRKNHYAYAVTGSVNEWRYKVGIDGEPAVGVALEVWDVNAGRVIWSGVGAKSGASGQAVSYVGQRLLADVMTNLMLG